MQSVASVRKFAKFIFQDAIISVCSTLRPGFADEVTLDILLVWRSESKQVYQLQLSMFVIPILLSFCLEKEASSIQDSAKTFSVAIRYYLLWNEKKELRNTQKFSQLTNNCRRYL